MMKTYQVTLPDEIAEMADQLLTDAKYESFDYMVMAAILALRDQVSWEDGLDQERLKQEIQKGIDSANRGGLVDGPAALQRHREKLEAARKQPS